MSDSVDIRASGEGPVSSERGRGEWVVRPRRAGLFSIFSEVWEFRALFPFLLGRSILQVYEKTLLNVIWFILRPASAVAAFMVIGDVIGIATGAVPLLLFMVTSFSLWMLFMRGLRFATRSLGRGAALTKRAGVPRFLFILVSVAGPTMVEFGIIFLSAVGIAIYFHVSDIYPALHGWQMLAAIPVFLLMCLLIIGLGCVTSVLMGIIVDSYIVLIYTLPAVFLITPCAYPLSAVPEDWRWIMELNPLTAMMETWRWALLGMAPPDWTAFGISALVILLVHLAGLAFFTHYERVVLDRT